MSKYRKLPGESDGLKQKEKTFILDMIMAVAH